MAARQPPGTTAGHPSRRHPLAGSGTKRHRPHELGTTSAAVTRPDLWQGRQGDVPTLPDPYDVHGQVIDVDFLPCVRTMRTCRASSMAASVRVSWPGGTAFVSVGPKCQRSPTAHRRRRGLRALEEPAAPTPRWPPPSSRPDEQRGPSGVVLGSERWHTRRHRLPRLGPPSSMSRMGLSQSSEPAGDGTERPGDCRSCLRKSAGRQDDAGKLLESGSDCTLSRCRASHLGFHLLEVGRVGAANPSIVYESSVTPLRQLSAIRHG
jgi:hypothetical protein